MIDPRFASAGASADSGAVTPAVCGVTVYEGAGPRTLPPAPPSPLQNAPAPQPGDCTDPNNWLPLSRANGFSCAVGVTLGGLPAAGAPKQLSVKPDKVALTALVTADGSLVFDLTVDFTNSLRCTAAAVLAVPRLPDLLLLEERHRAGDVTYEPKVLEKKRAQAAFDQAAASSTHSATLSDTMDDVFSVQLDKVAAGATAAFGCKFLARAGLRTAAAVVSSGDDDAARIADLAILPGFSPLDAAGVPFDFTLLADARYAVALPSDAVLREDAARVNHECTTANPHQTRLAAYGLRDDAALVHVCAIAQLAPSLAADLAAGSSMRAVRWSSHCGLAAGTLLKVRLVERAPSSSVDFSTLALEPPTPIADVDTCERVTFSAADGAPRDVSRVRLAVPATLPGAAPAAAPHALYVIVDTSGSTGMRVGGSGDCFLDKSKVLLDAILRALPDHVAALRGANAINSAPITVRLWRFDRETSKEHEVVLTAGADGGAVLAPLRASIGALHPGGCTNYDSWASELRAAVAASPSSLHSVLLVTDGGATQRERFFEAIEAIASQPGVDFFQCDALGYGPWLDPRTVTFLASATGGEAIMVESLDGNAVHKKVLGLLARSMLRAASRMLLRIDGGRLLAVRADATAADEAAPPPPKASIDALASDAITSGARGADDSAAFTLDVLPTANLCLAIDHPAGRPPALTVGGHPLPWPAATAAAAISNEATDPEDAPPPASALAVLQKLRSPATAHALRHLPLLEPAYAPPKSTSYPDETATARAAACLAISLKGQLVAPSVTKGVAVATLETALLPVPEQCRPKPAALGKAYEALGSFEDDSAGLSGCATDLMITLGLGTSTRAQVGSSSMGAQVGSSSMGCAAGAAVLGGLHFSRARRAAHEAAAAVAASAASSMAARASAGARAAPAAAAAAAFPSYKGSQRYQTMTAGFAAAARATASAAARASAGATAAPAAAAAAARPSYMGSQRYQTMIHQQTSTRQTKEKRARTEKPRPDSAPPSLPKWIGFTRGGLYPSDAAAMPRFNRLAKTAAAQRLGSRATLANALAELAPLLELAGSSTVAPAASAPLDLIDAVSSSHAFRAAPAGCGIAEDLLDLKVLRLVESTRQMYPEAAGTDAAWAAWAKEQKRGGPAAWTQLRCAWREALRQSVEGSGFFTKAMSALQKLPPLASDPRAWPWLEPAPASAPQPAAKSDLDPSDDASIGPGPAPAPSLAPAPASAPSPAPAPAAAPAPASAAVDAADASLPTGDISVVQALTDKERAVRAQQVDLFDPTTVRDCHSILVTPTMPGDPAAQPSTAAEAAAATGGHLFEVVLWARTPSVYEAGPPAAYAFGPRDAMLPTGFAIAADQTMLAALGRFGALEPHALAMTIAFESFLSKLVASVWTSRQVARLSVNFLVAFGAELTRRFDVHNRIRSTKLSRDEINFLRFERKDFIDQHTLSAFQDANTSGK